MKKMSLVLSVLMILVAANSAVAGIFGPSDEEIAACMTKYFQKPQAEMGDFMGLNLSLIESDADAKILNKALGALVEPLRAEYDQMVYALEAKGPEVDRFFNILYTKEIHDQLWEQTRPLKQSAYAKALAEYNGLFDQIRAAGTTVLKAEAIRDALGAISKRFKVIVP